MYIMNIMYKNNIIITCGTFKLNYDLLNSINDSFYASVSQGNYLRQIRFICSFITNNVIKFSLKCAKQFRFNTIK